MVCELDVAISRVVGEGRTLGSGVVEVDAQRSEGDSWPVGERAVSAGSVGGVERER